MHTLSRTALLWTEIVSFQEREERSIIKDMSDAKYGIKRMLLQLSRRAKSPYVKLRALELVMLHDGYDLSVLSNSPSGKANKKNANGLAGLVLSEPAKNQQYDFLVDPTYRVGL